MADMLERKKLIDYLPPFTQQFDEIKEIMETENKQFDTLNENLQKVLDNAFIADCDEYGIKKYESLLNLVPVPEDTLDSRKSRVLLRWNEYVPYTYRVLIRRLNAYCGVNNYNITEDLKRYYLHIRTNLNLYGQVTEFEKMCERIIPMNIEVTARNQMHQELDGTVFLGGAAVTANRERIINGKDGENNG